VHPNGLGQTLVARMLIPAIQEMTGLVWTLTTDGSLTALYWVGSDGHQLVAEKLVALIEKIIRDEEKRTK